MENKKSRRDILKLSGKAAAALGGVTSLAGCTVQDVTVEDLAEEGGNPEYFGRDVQIEGWLEYVDSEHYIQTTGGLQGVTYWDYFDHFYRLHSDEDKNSPFIYLIEDENHGVRDPYEEPEPEPFGNLDKEELYDQEVEVKGVYTAEEVLGESKKPVIPNVGYIRD